MTPKEKAIALRQLFAQELIDLTDNEDLLNSRIKECTLIAVNEILNSNPHANPLNTNGHSTMAYWLEVKKEIEKI